MRKRILPLILAVAMLVSSAAVLSACNKQEQLSVVFLGDSIAEAIIGPSPISERDRYGYFSLIGLNNGFKYDNRSVSGHQSDDLLEYISREETNAMLVQTLLKKADIIHISILGNDLLHNKMSDIIIAAHKDNLDSFERVFTNASQNIAAIVAKLKEYNPDAHIFFQNVYNPVYEETPLLNAETQTALQGEGIEPSDYRSLAAVLLNKINGILDKYLESNPGAFHIIDSYTEFEKIYNADKERGINLIFPDGIHPSNEGHAVLADITQHKLEELGLVTDKKGAVKRYRQLRIEQLERMFGGSLDVRKIKRQLKKADTCEEITKIYFEAIKGATPVYY